MSRAGYLRRPLTALLMLAALAASVVIAAVVLASPPAQAATTFTVTTAADERNTNNQCSLREAIINANQNNQSGSADCPAGVGKDTINFQASLSPATITLGSELTITDSAGLTIDGGSANITVSGSNAVRVFVVQFDADAKLTLNNLTVANANAAGAAGGGIYNEGTLTVNNSTLSGNRAFAEFAGGGGGIWNAASGTATVSNSTLSGNSTPMAGGGIFNQGGTLTVSNSTLSGNSANNGGGLGMNAGSVTLKNTIVANSPSGDNCSGTITNGGYNLDSDGSCGFGTTNHSLSGTTDEPLDPKLGSLANNDGPTLTHALLAGSPAIDKGNSFGATTDQRGVARSQGPAPDIGAFEVEDTIRPSGTVLINNGAARTNSTAVTLKLSATDPAPDSAVAQMRFSNNGSTWSGWEAYATTKGWTLSSANGTKTVYAQFKDGAGNVSVAAQDAIVLDTIKPRVSTATPTGPGIGRGTNIAATFSEAMDASPTATDGDPSTINGTTFKLFKQGSTTKVAAAVSYDATTKKATLNPNANLQRGTKYRAVVTTGAQDLAGNRLDQNSNLDGLQQKTWTFKIRN